METTTAKPIFRLLEATGLVLLTVVKVKKKISLKISVDPLKFIHICYQKYLYYKFSVISTAPNYTSTSTMQWNSLPRLELLQQKRTLRCWRWRLR